MNRLLGQRVRLHVNLQNGSIAVSEKTASGWRVAGYTCGATLSNATPRRTGDSAKVWATRIRKGRRAVVAWIEGTLTALDVAHGTGHPVRYNPHRCRDFTRRDGSILPAGTRFGTFTAIAGQCGYAQNIREQ